MTREPKVQMRTESRDWSGTTHIAATNAATLIGARVIATDATESGDRNTGLNAGA